MQTRSTDVRNHAEREHELVSCNRVENEWSAREKKTILFLKNGDFCKKKSIMINDYSLIIIKSINPIGKYILRKIFTKIAKTILVSMFQF